MVDEKLDLNTHDMFFAGYDEATVSGKEQVAQSIKMRLLMVMGELFESTQRGMDYINTIFGGNGDPAIVDALIKSTITATPEVTGIVSYTSSADRGKRTIIISATVDTVYGTVYLNQQGILA